MELCKCVLFFLFLVLYFEHGHLSDVNTDEIKPHCKYMEDMDESDPSEDLTFTLSDLRSETALEEKRKQSQVCLPDPWADLEAYSGFISIDRKQSTEYNKFFFFLYMKSKEDPPQKKPLLLWLQGGPGKSSLFGEFLENGPLGIDAGGKLYYRNHTLLNYFDIIYLDQPLGSGYSFDRTEKYRGKLQNISADIIRFLRRFSKIYTETKNSDFFIAGESYGARFAVGVASKWLEARTDRPPLQLKGVILGVGFLFPLLDIIDSSDYLYYTTLLDEEGRAVFAESFQLIRRLAEEKNYTAAGYLLSKTVLNLRQPGEQSLFQKLTGFQHHGSIMTPERKPETFAYYMYANSTDFKKRIHVGSWRTLDSARANVALALAEEDFFLDHKQMLSDVLNNKHVLVYTAQLDDVFPAVNIRKGLRDLLWRGSAHFKNATRTMWHQGDNASLPLFGYEKKAGALMYAHVLFGGHYVSLDRSFEVSDLYRRFLHFQKTPLPPAC